MTANQVGIWREDIILRGQRVQSSWGGRVTDVFPQRGWGNTGKDKGRRGPGQICGGESGHCHSKVKKLVPVFCQHHR